MSLIQPLPAGALDIVGDIHGEYDALVSLLGHLGYDEHGHHAQGRTLVFVGDFCDRGPNSPAVLALVQRLVESGRAVAILGNHEINLLREDAKDGSGWFFDARMVRDHDKYAPFQRLMPTPAQALWPSWHRCPLGWSVKTCAWYTQPGKQTRSKWSEHSPWAACVSATTSGNKPPNNTP